MILTYHDIAPIPEFNPPGVSPPKAIITVSVSNPYGHPSPRVPLDLIDKVGAENVLFTGSKDQIVIGTAGIEHASYTAAMRDSYLAFVRSGLRRAIEKKTLTSDSFVFTVQKDIHQ